MSIRAMSRIVVSIQIDNDTLLNIIMLTIVVNIIVFFNTSFMAQQYEVESIMH